MNKICCCLTSLCQSIMDPHFAPWAAGTEMGDLQGWQWDHTHTPFLLLSLGPFCYISVVIYCPYALCIIVGSLGLSELPSAKPSPVFTLGVVSLAVGLEDLLLLCCNTGPACVAAASSAHREMPLQTLVPLDCCHLSLGGASLSFCASIIVPDLNPSLGMECSGDLAELRMALPLKLLFFLGAS